MLQCSIGSTRLLVATHLNVRAIVLSDGVHLTSWHSRLLIEESGKAGEIQLGLRI